MSCQTSPTTAAFIQSHLDADLERLVQQQQQQTQGERALQPVLPPDCRNGLLPTHDTGAPSLRAAHSFNGEGGGAGAGAFRPAFLSSAETATRTDHSKFMILQVVAVQDVSLPLEQRLRAIAGDQATLSRLQPTASGSSHGRGARRARANGALEDSSETAEEDGDEESARSGAQQGASVADSVLQASEAAEEIRRQQRKRQVSARRRWLSLVLTDGFTRVLAVEARPPLRIGTDTPNRNSGPHGSGRSTALLPAGVAVGAKLKVFLTAHEGGHAQGEAPVAWHPAHSHGVLRLHSDNTQLLGGSVAALEVYWQRWAVAQLTALSGRPVTTPALPTAAPTAADAIAHAISGGPIGTAVEGGAEPHTQHTDAASARPHNRQNGQQQQQQQQESMPSMLCLPVSQWPTRPASSHGLFLTRAVIERVISDLLINEHEGEEEAGEEGDGCSYSLVVALCSPEASQHANGLGAAAEDNFSLHVDLGNAWLQGLIGMPASRFKLFSQSQVPGEVEQLESIIERVQSVLESLGEAFFYLRRRVVDGAIEVVKVEPVVGTGGTQQQQFQSGA